jgi:hypothetical protein
VTERGTGHLVLAVGVHHNCRLVARALRITDERVVTMCRPAHLVGADDLTQQEECDEETDDQGKKHKG